MMVLGIETSCDETAVAIVDEQYKIVAEILTRQAIHEKWGGVVPESASRAHLELIDTSVEKVCSAANINLKQLQAIAVTTGPGLAGALWIGLAYAMGLSEATKIPIFPVHHLEAHIWTVKLAYPKLEPPFIALLVSGGHTLLIHIHSYRNYKVVGRTRDDSIGEAFDKAARLLHLGYPGGPAIENEAHKYQKKDFYKLPITDLVNSFDFSFSGLKTALRVGIEKHPNISVEEWAHSFQYSAIHSLLKPVIRYWETNPTIPLVISGGVAANKLLRKKLEEYAEKKQRLFYATPLPYCTDNGVMIAIAGIQMIKELIPVNENILTIHPRWNIEEINRI